MHRLAGAAAGLLVLGAAACSLVYSPDDYEGGGGSSAGGDVSRSDGGEGGSALTEAGASGDGGFVCVYDAPVYHVHDPTRSVDIYTLSTNEVANAAAAGYTEDRGVAFRAATLPGGSRSPVYRVLSPSNGDRIWTISAGEKATLPSAGYTRDEGVGFYANGLNVPCTVPVRGFQRQGRHQVAATTSEIAALLDAGWHDEGIRFYAAPP